MRLSWFACRLSMPGVAAGSAACAALTGAMTIATAGIAVLKALVASLGQRFRRMPFEIVATHGAGDAHCVKFGQSLRSVHIMISREPTLERLATARALLLEPFGLNEASLRGAAPRSRAHTVDDADLYFQYTRSEGWSLEEGIVKTGSFSIDQGVGVRAVSGEKTAFAYSDDISEASLLDAARTVRTIAAARAEPQGQGRRASDDRRQPRAVRADGPDRHARQHGEGRAARNGRRSWRAPRTRAWRR